MLSCCGYLYDSLFKWKLGLTIMNSHVHSLSCCLCGLTYVGGFQQHLLTDCPITVYYLQTYFDKVSEISQAHFNDLTSTPVKNRWIWILTSGENKANRLTHSDYISEGHSVSGSKNKQSKDHCLQAIREHQQIVEELGEDAMRIYTDGSKTENGIGAGYAVYQNNILTQSVSCRLEKCENNAAELFAIYKAVLWTNSLKTKQKVKTLHIFSDSRYSIDTLCCHTKSNCNHRLLNEIHNALESTSSKLILHWIPSHVEVKEGRQTFDIIGNTIADTLAREAADNINARALNYDKYFVASPKQLTEASAHLTSSIDSMLQSVQTNHDHESSDSQPSGPSSDDFSLADAQQGPCSQTL